VEEIVSNGPTGSLFTKVPKTKLKQLGRRDCLRKLGIGGSRLGAGGSATGYRSRRCQLENQLASGQPTAQEQRPHTSPPQAGPWRPPARGSSSRRGWSWQRQEPLRQNAVTLRRGRTTPTARPVARRAHAAGTGTRPRQLADGATWEQRPSERGYPERLTPEADFFPIGKPWIRPLLDQAPLDRGPLDRGLGRSGGSCDRRPLDRAPIGKSFPMKMRLKAAASTTTFIPAALDDPGRPGLASRCRFDSPLPSRANAARAAHSQGRSSGRFRAVRSLDRQETPGCRTGGPTPEPAPSVEPDSDGESPQGKGPAPGALGLTTIPVSIVSEDSHPRSGSHQARGVLNPGPA